MFCCIVFICKIQCNVISTDIVAFFYKAGFLAKMNNLSDVRQSVLNGSEDKGHSNWGKLSPIYLVVNSGVMLFPVSLLTSVVNGMQY